MLILISSYKILARFYKILQDLNKILTWEFLFVFLGNGPFWNITAGQKDCINSGIFKISQTECSIR